MIQRSPEIEAAYARLLEAWSTGDVDSSMTLGSDDEAASLFGSGLGHFFSGEGTFTVLAPMAKAFHKVGLRVSPGNPVGYADGVTGWVVDHPVWHTAAGKEASTRMTLIYRQEGDDWKLAHMHHSMGIPDEQDDLFREAAAAMMEPDPA